MSRLYRTVRPLLFALPSEIAHQWTHGIGAAVQGSPIEALLERRYRPRDHRLQIERWGTSFPTPLGIAAGFDKNARIPRLLGGLGFGHVEIGGVTARPQAGNPKPRLFRLPQDRALINRMGFNNDGADRIAERLAALEHRSVPIGINLGKTKEVPAEYAPDDYVYSFERLRPYGDFFVINVSSPNTPGLRDLQQREHLEGIAGALLDAGASPLLVKLSPDLHTDAILDLIDLVEEFGLDGIIATNTTVDRPNLQSPYAAEPGGLSGAPLEERSTEVIATVARHTDVPIIGVGGIFTAEDAYKKLRAGASLIQLYTGLIYQGPGIARDINQGLIARLERDGFSSVEDVIGVDVD